MDFSHIENYCKISDETRKVIAEEMERLEVVDREARAKVYFKCCKNHVLIGPDFDIITNTWNSIGNFELVHSDHNIHIFISAEYESLHDGSLNKFLKEIIKRTNHIFIHIPRSSREIRSIVEGAIEPDIQYRIFIEKDNVTRIFYYNETFGYKDPSKFHYSVYTLIRKYLILIHSADLHRYYHQFTEIYGGHSINEFQ